MPEFVGFANSNFDPDRYRLEMTDPTICPHCGKSSHDPVDKVITVSNSNIPEYDEEVLKKAIEDDTLNFGI